MSRLAAASSNSGHILTSRFRAPSRPVVLIQNSAYTARVSSPLPQPCRISRAPFVLGTKVMIDSNTIEERSMVSVSPLAPISRGTLWTARTLSTLVVIFLLFDSTLHLLKPAPVVEAFNRLGYPLSASVGIGLLELLCLIAYATP